VLAAVYVPQWTRHVRASLLDALSEEHVRAARARGISETRIVLRHALRPALVPVVTLGGVQLPALFTGAVITETIFAWPGMGRLFYDGIERFDYPRLMGLLVISSVFIVLGNLAADLVNARLDPRVQLGREA
jgi:peptide/nickel transport system permease protein